MTIRPSNDKPNRRVNYLLRLVDILFLARPVVLIPVWGFSILGYWTALRAGDLQVSAILFGREFFAVFDEMAVFSLAVAAVYVVNQIADYTVDAANDGFPLMVKARIGAAEASVFAALCAVAAIGVPLLTGEYVLTCLAAAAIVLGIVYSFRPVYLSGRPFADFIANAAGFGIIAFGTGWRLAHGEGLFSYHFFSAALPYILIMCAGSIHSTFPDVPGDRRCGKNTTAVYMGIFPAHLLALFFVLSGGGAALISRDPVAGLIALVFLAIDLLYVFRRTQPCMEATYKISGGFAMVIIGILYPLFIPAAAGVFCFTWIYFRVRFSVSYPSLVPLAHE
jgi:4-hydroxybenzoate polyprenyltransferase